MEELSLNDRLKPYFEFSLSDKKVIFVSTFIASNLISNILATKVFSLGFWGLTTDCGNLLFPLGYLMADVITEVYGEREARRAIFYGLIANIALVVTTAIAIQLPYPSYWGGQDAFTFIFSFAPRIVIASFLGYLAGQYTNARLMVRIKEKYPKHLFVRTIGSTLGGELADTLIFANLAFYGIVPNSEIIVFIVVQYVVKVLWEVIMQPLTYKSVDWAKKDC